MSTANMSTANMSTPTHAVPHRTSALPILRRTLLDGWRGLVGWALGIVAVLALYLPLYPTLQGPEITELIDQLPAELVQTLGYDDMASGAGYAQASFFGLLGFVLITIASIGWGAAAIAGQEETGRLELTLAHAVGRVQVALESAAALIVKLLFLGGVVFGLLTVMSPAFELDLEPANILATTLAWVGLGALAGTTALAAGALTGRRVWALGAGAAVAVLGYAFDAVGKMNDGLEWLRNLSPFAWAYGFEPLANGVDWGGLGLLWGVSALLVAVAAWALSRRDVLG